MGTENIDYTAVLADMEAKRTVLDAAITNLRLFLTGQVAPASLSSNSSNTAIPTCDVPAGAFFGKSIPEASKLYLQIMKRKSTSKDIADGLRRGGMESTSTNFNGIVHAVLDRARKAGGDVIKIDRSYWGLAEWYPAGVRASAVHEKRTETGRNRGTQGKASRPRKKKHVTRNHPVQPGLEHRIEAILLSDKKKIFNVTEITSALGAETKALQLTLGRMVAKKKIEKTQGGYRALSDNVQQMPLAV